MIQRNDGENTCLDSRSTRTTRCSRGSIRRSLVAATVPPIPPPRIRTVLPFAIALSLKWDDFVRPLCPYGEFGQGAFVGSFQQLGFGDSTRIHTGTAYADLRAVAYHPTEHQLDVVEPLRHLLPGFGTSGGVPDQKYFHFFAFCLRQRSRQAQAVVAPLRTVWRVVEDKEGLHGAIAFPVIRRSGAQPRIPGGSSSPCRRAGR